MKSKKKIKKEIENMRKINELRNKIFKTRVDSVFQSTICFFCNDEKTGIAPAGSGVFIKYNDNYYVVSAAHVLAEHYNDTFVILDDNELKIGGQLISSKMPKSESRGDDKIDISIIKVDEKSEKALLKSFSALDASEIGIGHNLSNEGAYFSVGFPLTKTKKNGVKMK